MVKCIKDTIKNINIVIVCDIGCPYCYARINCMRFHSTDDFTKPVFFENKLKMMRNPKHRAYFMTGQSDLSGWKDEWKEQVFAEMKNNPKTQFLFLSKRPEKVHIENAPENGWFGVTVTRASEKKRIDDLRRNVHGGHLHITFEPLFDEIGEVDLTGIEWIVIGTETGNRKNKAVSQRQWIFDLYEQAKKQKIPVFMKEDLLGILSEEEMIQEFPVSFTGGIA